MRKRTTLFKQAKEKEDIKISKLCPISPCTTAGEYQEIQNPKLRIAQRASILSDISVEDAHTIDDYNLYKALGEFNIGLISEKFHSKCINDKDEWFRSMFQYSPLDDIISTFSEYLMQRFGGPQYYTDNKGMPNLVQAHREIEMTVRTAQKWCDHMEETIDELVAEKVILEKFRNILMNYFKYSAYNLVAAQEAQCLMVKMGCRDELKEELEYDNEVLL